MTETKKAETEAAKKGTEAQQREQQPKEETGDLLEADDLFEEFANEEWVRSPDDEQVPLWEADWEDENVADDFMARLKAELDARSMKD